MSTLAEKLGQDYITEDSKQDAKKISVSGINTGSMGDNVQGTKTVDITREQWFWDMAVIS